MSPKQTPQQKRIIELEDALRFLLGSLNQPHAAQKAKAVLDKSSKR